MVQTLGAGQRLEAIKKVTNQEVLTKVANNDEDERVRKTVKELLE